jgi:hypothetical protein
LPPQAHRFVLMDFGSSQLRQISESLMTTGIPVRCARLLARERGSRVFVAAPRLHHRSGTMDRPAISDVMEPALLLIASALSLQTY